MAQKDTQRTFQALVDSDRKRKQHEALASQMLGKGRRTSTPTGTRPSGPSASLASRVGINKRSSSSGMNGQWTHDLHDARAARPRLSNQRTQSMSRLERESRLQKNLNRSGLDQFKATTSSNKHVDGQLSIRGMASGGPFVVIASNFAPGTTAADIESAMGPVGLTLQGDQCLQRCRVLSNQPTVLAELEFADRHGAENVIATFNNQKADGRILYVYMKQGGPTPVRNDPVPVTVETASEPVQLPSTAIEDESNAPQGDDIMVVDTVGDRRHDSRHEAGRLDSRERARDGSYQDGRYGYEGQSDKIDRQPRQQRGGGSSFSGRYDNRNYSDRAFASNGRRRY